MKDGRPFTFAGLWENWKDPESGEWLRTCTIITGEPNELVAQIHPRMPVILAEQHHAAWLGETDNGNLKELLLPYSADEMRMWEISPRVNSRRMMIHRSGNPFMHSQHRRQPMRLNSCARSAEAHPVREPLTDKTTSTAPPA